jgi:hypothetical protein
MLAPAAAKAMGRKEVKKGILRDTVEVIEFGHSKRSEHLITIHSYEPVLLRTMV